MKKRKTIIAAVVLLLVFVVGGAIAYFTDTDSATNTFTIGNVDITLTEPLWTQLSKTEGDANLVDDAENMMPGEDVTKDPTINNVSTKNDAYVFAKVVVPCSNVIATDDTDDTETPVELFTYTVNTGWTELTSEAVACTAGGTATHVYYYGTGSLTKLNKAASASAPTSTSTPLFSKVTLLGTLKSADIPATPANKEIVVTAYGIQADGLASTVPATVWGYFA